MTKISSNATKILFLLAFVLVFFAENCYSQEDKYPARFHFNTKTGKLEVGDKVNLTFLLSDIKNNDDYLALQAKLSKQDGIRKVVMSPLDESKGTALCVLTFSNLPGNPFKPNHLQKIFSYLSIPNVYFDNDLVETKNITGYLLTKEKQAHPDQIGK